MGLLSHIALLLAQAAANPASPSPAPIVLDEVSYRWVDAATSHAAFLAGVQTWQDWQATPHRRFPCDTSPCNDLVLRFRLPETVAALRSPTLHVPLSVANRVDLYARGALMTQLASLEPDLDDPLLRPGHIIEVFALPLQTDWAGEHIYLRIHSLEREVGFTMSPLLMSRHEVERFLFHHEAVPLIVGVAGVVVGALVLAMFLASRRDPAHLAYACVLLSFGWFFVARVHLPTTMLDWHLLKTWRYAPLFFFLPSILLLVRLLYQPQHELVWLRRMTWVTFAFACGTAGAKALLGVRLRPFLMPWELLALAAIPFALHPLIRGARQGDKDSKVLLVGLAAVAVTGVFDIVGDTLELGLRVGAYGIVAMLVSQGVILGMRFVRVHRQLETYSTDLEKKNVELERLAEAREQLNEELRHQVSARSEQLFSLVARMGAAEEDALQLRPGMVVHGRYRVKGCIGAGGMGAVYDVERVSNGERAALKVATGLDARALARLAREAHMASQVTHPNLVRMLDVDIASAGFLFVVMEYVDGPSLSEQRHRWGETGWALVVLRQVAAGLAALHAQGVLHRDLKPSNVVLCGAVDSEAPDAKIVDFGIARTGGGLLSAVAESEPGDEEPTRQVPLDTPTTQATLFARSPPPQAGQPSHEGPKTPGTYTGAARALAAPSPATEEKGHRRANAPVGPTDTHRHPGPAQPQTSTAPPRPDHATRDRTAGPKPDLSESTPLTVTCGAVSGTPPYMAPELLYPGTTLEPASDMFALGVLAWELLAGQRPFHMPPVLMLEANQPYPDIPPLAERVPGLRPAVGEMLDRCLCEHPTQRPSAEEIAAVLTREAI